MRCAWPTGTIGRDIWVGEPALAGVVQAVGAVQAAVRCAPELGGDRSGAPGVADRGPCLGKEVYLVVGNADMGSARRAAVGGLVPLGEAGADMVTVGSGHR